MSIFGRKHKQNYGLHWVCISNNGKKSANVIKLCKVEFSKIFSVHLTQIESSERRWENNHYCVDFWQNWELSQGKVSLLLRSWFTLGWLHDVYSCRLGVICSRRFVLFWSFWRLLTIKMIKSVKVFPFSFWKIITKKNLLHKIQTPGINMQNGRQVI